MIGPPEMNDPDGAVCRGESVTFEVLGPPQPWQRVTPLGEGKSVRPKATRLYQRAVRVVAELHLGRWRKDGLYRLHVHAVFADNRRRDADNVGKSCGDALNGIAYEDDSQVVDSRSTKAVEPGRARTVITIERIGDAPQKRCRHPMSLRTSSGYGGAPTTCARCMQVVSPKRAGRRG